MIRTRPKTNQVGSPGDGNRNENALNGCRSCPATIPREQDSPNDGTSGLGEKSGIVALFSSVFSEVGPTERPPQLFQVTEMCFMDIEGARLT